MTQRRIPIDIRALVDRVRRRLIKDHKQLLKRGGAYILIDTLKNVAVREIDDIEQFAREIGALYEYEELKKKK